MRSISKRTIRELAEREVRKYAKEHEEEIAFEIYKRTTTDTVRQTEALVAHLTKAKARSAPAAPSPAAVDYVRALERELEDALGRKVRLVEGRKKGRIELEYYGAEDREKLIENLRLFSSLRRNK